MHLLSIFGIVFKFISKHGKCLADFSNFAWNTARKFKSFSFTVDTTAEHWENVDKAVRSTQ